MEIECLLENIQSPFNHLTRVVHKSSTLPALQGILLETKGNKLIATATNIENSLRITIPVKSEKDSSVLVPGELLSKVILNLPSSLKKIKIYTENETTLVIETEKTKSTLTLLQKADFPSIPTIEGTKTIVQKNILQEGIASTLFATATTEIKPEIAALYIYTEPGVLVFVGTDSFRLAEKKIKVKNTKDLKVLIPNKNATELLKMLEVCGDDCELVYSDTMLALQSSTVYFTTRVVDGVFPDYVKIIPKEETTTALILKQDLVQTLKSTTLFSDTFNQITIVIDSEKNELITTTKNQQTGESVYTIPAKIEGKSLSIHFNYRYIQDVLSIVNKDSILISATTEQKAVILRAYGDTSFIYLIMPLNR